MLKNNSIELYRFLYCIMVVLVHCFYEYKKWGGGYIAVEFFFLLSGYLLAAKVTGFRDSCYLAGDAAIHFTAQKVKRLFPYTTCAFFLYFADEIVSGQLGIIQSFKLLLRSKWELFYLYMTGPGIAAGILNYPMWYISALILAGFLVFYLYYKRPKLFVYLFAPILAIVIYGYFFISYGNIDHYVSTGLIGIPDGLLRAFAGLSLGVLCFHLSQRLRVRSYNHWIEGFFQLAEPCGLLFTFAIAFFTRRTYLDFLAIPAFFLIITISFSRDTWCGRLFSNQVCRFLGRISMPIYLLHIIIHKWQNSIYHIQNYWMSIFVFLIIIVLVSILFDYIMRFIKKMKKIKKVGL